MAWESCILILNSDSTGSFYTGDIVTGSAVLEFKDNQKIENIEFKVTGISKIQWTRSMPTMPYIKNYSKKEKVLDLNIEVFRDLKGKSIRSGIQTFHFHFTLPFDLPSTYESPIANTRYFIKVEGKAAYKFKKQKVAPFIVHGNINLNNIEDYLKPSFYESKKFFWKSGNVSIRIKTYKGCAPMQYVPFEVIIINENKVKINKIRITLMQKLKCSTISGYAEEEKKIFKVEHTKLCNTVTETCTFGMEIPQTVPSSVHLTDPMIDISYIFRVEVFFSFHTTHLENIPVTVASIPVMHLDFEQTS